jgi:hypothetical protein
VYVRRNSEARSRNNCRRGKAINVTYSECVSVALVMQHVKRMRGIILSSVAPLSYHTFPHYLINVTIFEKKIKNVVKINVCFEFLYNFHLKHSSFYKNSVRYHKYALVFM